MSGSRRGGRLRPLNAILCALLVPATLVGTGASRADATAPGAISGRVVDASGTPVEKGTVWIGTAAGQYVEQVYVEPDGTFIAGDLAAGTYKVQIWDRSYSFVTEWYDNQPNLAAATPVVVGSDPVALGDIALALKPIPPEASIAGVVRAPNGDPVEGVTVGAYAGPDFSYEETVTDARGRYWFIYLESYGVTSFRLLASPDLTEDDSEFGYRPTWSGAAHSYDDAEAVPLTPGGLTSHDLTLFEAGGIRGVVRRAGQPVAGIKAWAYDSSGNYFRGAVTDDAGQFQIRELVPGEEYRLWITPGGVGMWWGGIDLASAEPLEIDAGTWTDMGSVSYAPNIRALTPPKIDGLPYVGSIVFVKSGKWSVNGWTTYEWLRGTTVVGTEPGYVIQPADRRHSLRVRVTHKEIAGYDSVSTTITTSRVQDESDVQVSVAELRTTATGTKVLIKVKVACLPGCAPTGTVRFVDQYRGSQRLLDKIVLKRGKARLRATVTGKGIHALTAGYSGDAWHTAGMGMDTTRLG